MREDPSHEARGLHNLPARLTSFVGREHEIAEIGALLEAERLVMLVGAPGVGKTRLSLQIAASVLDSFPDGVWLVELAPLADPTFVPRAVADALGVREQPGRTLTATLAGYLRTRRLLLVLDNCEHLIGAVATLAETLLRACPDLHVLATSREPLAIEGETVRRVPSLSVPDVGDAGVALSPAATLPALAASEAVRLFVERARAASPTFALTERNAGLIGQICARLDGIPLALELTAARVRALSVEQIAARLDDRFNLLSGGSRTALPRQQTLRGAVDWSYDLLSEPEQVLLRHLAVFAGGFTLEAADAVAGDARSVGASLAAPAHTSLAAPAHTSLAPRPSPLDTLVSLVDKSLVQVEEDADAEPRYRLLETLRQYGHEKLIEHGELEALRDRHRDYFLALAEEIGTALNERSDGASLTRLEPEHDNLRAALGWCVDEAGDGCGGQAGSDDAQQRGGAAHGVRLAAAVWRFWWLRGHIGEGRRWLERVLCVPPTDTSTAGLSARATALLGIANLSAYQGDYRAAVTHMTENLAFCRETANDHGVITALHRLGFYLVHLGEHERAVQLCEESVALGRRVGDRVALAIALHTSGIVLYMVGRYEQSVALSEEAIGLLRELGNPTVIAYALRSQACAIAESGDPARAIRLADEGLRISRDVGDKRGIGQSYKDLARFALLAGDIGRAAELVRTSITICDELGDRWFIANCLYVLAGVKRAQGASPSAGVPSRRDHLEESARLFGAAAALREQAGVAVFPEIQRFDHDQKLLGAALGETAFAQAIHEGRSMSLKQAVDFALETTAPPLLTVADQRSEQETQQETSMAGPLTPREREIAILVAAGLTNRQIAERLVLTQRTAETHVHNIFGKLDLTSRAQVAVWVVEHGLTGSR